NDQKRIFPVSTILNGEYGLKDVCLGVPVVLGRGGIEKIIEIDLNNDEMAMLNTSSGHVKEVMKALDDMNLF
ncbi:MAG: malate dehydrogenase, partial [Bacteroidales bacterium]